MGRLGLGDESAGGCQDLVRLDLAQRAHCPRRGWHLGATEAPRRRRQGHLNSSRKHRMTPIAHLLGIGGVNGWVVRGYEGFGGWKLLVFCRWRNAEHPCILVWPLNCIIDDRTRSKYTNLYAHLPMDHESESLRALSHFFLSTDTVLAPRCICISPASLLRRWTPNKTEPQNKHPPTPTPPESQFLIFKTIKLEQHLPPDVHCCHSRLRLLQF